MVKNKFFKNLYQSISALLCLLILDMALLAGYFESLKHGDNVGWILLAIVGGLTLLFFTVGSYFIFQKVEFDGDGIKITFIGTVLRSVSWNDVVNVSVGSVGRNPVFILTIKNGKNINVDYRKSVKAAIEHFGNKTIKGKL